MNIKKAITISSFAILCSLRAEAGGYYKCTDSSGAVSYGPHVCVEGQNQHVIESETLSHEKEQKRQEQASIVNERRDARAVRDQESRSEEEFRASRQQEASLEEEFQRSLSRITGAYGRAQLIERRMAQIANKKSGNTSVNNQKNQIEDEQRQLQSQINSQQGFIQGKMAAQKMEMEAQMRHQINAVQNQKPLFQ